MDGIVWTRAVSTVLATLENALLEGNSASTQSAGNSAIVFSRKHTRKAPSSDTVSDIEMPGSPVKRRRESTSSTALTGGSGDTVKPSAKSRKLSTTLSRQFARSLSVSNGDNNVNCSHVAATLDRLPLTNGGTVSSPISLVLSSSSSSSTSPIPVSMVPCHTTDPGSALLPLRTLVYPAANRSTKAREKSQVNTDEFGTFRKNGAQQMSQSSMDMDNSDNTSNFKGNSGKPSGSAVNDEDIFAVLFRSLSSPLDRMVDAESVQAAVQQWAGQACAADEPPTLLVELADCRVSRLKELLPAILAHLCSDHGSPDSAALLRQGAFLRELCHAICEAADIGEWLLQRRFCLLPLLLLGLASDARALSMLCQATKMARVCKDMYSAVQWTPQFSASLSEMAAEYEEVVCAKRALYGDIVAQGGLAWKAAGLPVDALLLARVKQWMESASGQCLKRIAHVFERRAKSSSAYNDEVLSGDALLHCSTQVLQSAALSAATCGDPFPSLAPYVVYIAAECTMWTCGKFAERQQQRYRGKQLSSRAMRLLAACESVLKILALAKAILVGDSTLSVFDLSVAIDYADDASAALEALAASLVEFSWLLAEAMSAFHAEGQVANPTGTMVLFADSVARFARRVVEFGGRLATTSEARRYKNMCAALACIKSGTQ